MDRDDDILLDDELDLRDIDAQQALGKILAHKMLDMQMSNQEVLAILIDEENRTITVQWEISGEA